MKKQYCKTQRRKLPGIGIIVSMILVLSLLTGAAMPPGTAGTAGDMPRGVPESVKARLAEENAAFDDAIAAFDESRAEAEADMEEGVDEDADGLDAAGDEEDGIGAFSAGDEGMAWLDGQADFDHGAIVNSIPWSDYSVNTGDYVNITDIMDIDTLMALYDAGDAENLSIPESPENAGNPVAVEGFDETGIDEDDISAIDDVEIIDEPLDAESLEYVDDAESVDGDFEEPVIDENYGENDEAQTETGIAPFASYNALAINLADFPSVFNVERIIEVAYTLTDNLIVFNTGAPFRADSGFLNITLNSRRTLVWDAAYTGSANGCLINIKGDGVFILLSNGAITYSGNGVAVDMSHGKSLALIYGGKISASKSTSHAFNCGGEAIVFSGNISATDGCAIYGNFVAVDGGTVSATSGRAIACKKAEVAGGTVKTNNGTAIESNEAVVIKGTVSATNGWAIDSKKTDIVGGTVSATTGKAIVANKTAVYGGTVKATGSGGIAISSGDTIVYKGAVSATTGSAIKGNYAGIAGGTVSATSGRAIESTTVEVVGGTVSAASGKAIDGKNVRIAGGTVSATTDTAIKCTQAEVAGGTVKATGSGGTAINSSVAIVRKGTVSATNGCAIDTSNVSISGGTVSATSGIAIDTYYGKITGGTIKATSGTGIRFDEDLTVSGGTVSSTSSRAIHASGGSAELYVKKGTVKTTTGKAIFNDGLVNVSGGTVSATDSKGTAIAGDKLTSDTRVTAGKVTSKSGYAIDTAGDINITGGTVTGARSSAGNITVSGGNVNGAETVNAAKTITVSGKGLVTSSKASAVIAAGKVEIKDGGRVTNSHATAPAVSSEGEVKINNGSVTALGKNSSAISSAGMVTVDGGMVVAGLNGNSIEIEGASTVEIKNGEVYGLRGSAISIDNAASAIVSGGIVDSFGGDYGIEADGNVTVTDGVVAAEEGIAIYGNNSKKLSFTGGFVFAGREPIVWNGNDAVVSTGNGIKCKWDNYDPWNKSYLVGEGAGLAWAPTSATVEWAKSNPGYTAFGIRYENSTNKGFHEVVDAMVFESAAERDAISISPNHVIITEAGQTVDLVAALNVDGAIVSNIKWSREDVNDAITFNGLNTPTATGDRVTIAANTSDITTLDPQTVRVTAVYDDEKVTYTATSTIEIMPGGIGTLGKDGDTTITLLEKKVTVNRAKTVGARVPILITKRNDLAALSLAPMHEAPTGQLAVDGVKLEYEKSKNKWAEVPLYEARICPTNDRYIEISADLKAKKRNNVRVSVRSSIDGAWYPAANKLDLAVSTKYPKVTLKAGGTLNQKFRSEPVSLTATSSSGLCSPISIEGQKAKDDGKVVLTNDGIKIGSLKTAATVKTRVNVAVAGYKPMPKNKWPKLNVKVVNALPKLKLSKKSVTLLDEKLFGPAPASLETGDNAEVMIELLSGDKKVPFENWYTVKSVTSLTTKSNGKKLTNPTTVDVTRYANGVIYIKPEAGKKTGNTSLVVTVETIAEPKAESKIFLPLKVTVLDKVSKVTLKGAPKAATVNTNHFKTGKDTKIADIPFALNTENLVLGGPVDWKITSVKDGKNEVSAETRGIFDDAIEAVPSDNMLTLSVADGIELAKLTEKGKAKTYTLTIGSPAKLPGKTFTFSLTVSDKAPSFTTKAGKAKIDVAKEGSAMDVTVALKDTNSAIDRIFLFDVSDDIMTPPVENPDFEVQAGSINGMKFKIVAKHDKVVPNVTQKVEVGILLANGTTVNSWNPGINGKPIGAPLAITPVQTKPKATQSAKSLTFYKTTPLEGKTIEFGFKKPEAYKLGAARISKDSLNPYKDNSGFELVQCGDGAWNLRFEGSKRPTLLNGKLMSSAATLKIELWAEGTYEICDDPASPDYEKPVALKDANGKARTTPTIAKVKVSIK